MSKIRDWFWLETREGTEQTMLLVVKSMKQFEKDQMVTLVLTDLAEDYHKNEKDSNLDYSFEQTVTIEEGTSEVVFSCSDVRLWDVEHPWLYRAVVKVTVKENQIDYCEKKIGFRTLERVGKQLLWNHQPLKLKGICYRERENDWKGTCHDLELFSRANINFIRSIYAPFSSKLLEKCDEMGILVENTAPFYDIGQSKPATQDLPHCQKMWQDSTWDMLENGSHVSILIWSLGHDCAWGANFRKAAETIRSMDGVRPLTFHLPMSIPEEDTPIDVWPVHYVDWKQPFDACFDQMVIFHTPGAENEIGYMEARKEQELPVLHEVWSPIACHNRAEIRQDGGVRNFWGESIRRFVQKSYETKGCLGGAVLAGVDEDGSFEGMGQYAWGILDENHCKKWEYELLKEAYSPVKLSAYRSSTGKIKVEIQNQWMFTDLSECVLVMNGTIVQGVVLRGQPGSVTSYEIEAMKSEEVTISVESKTRRCYGTVTCGIENASKEKSYLLLPLEEAETMSIGETEDGRYLCVSNSIFKFVFNKETFLLERATVKGENILAGGPFLNTTGLLLGKWIGKSLNAKYDHDCVLVTIEGSYENVLDVRFLLRITGNGALNTSYEVLELYRHMPHTVKAEIGMCPGGLNEKGVAYMVAEGFDQLVWNGKARGSIWDSQHHMKGVVLTNATGVGIEVIGEEKNGSIRLEQAHQITKEAIINDRDGRMIFNGNWHEMDDYCGNYAGTETLSREAGDTMKISFKGKGICLYGPLDMNYGYCDIYLDGQLVTENVSQYLDKVDFPGVSRGYEKQYGLCLYQVHDLVEGEHELLVSVKGTSPEGAQNTYTSIDYAVLEGESYPVGIRLNVNQDYNYTRLVRGCYKRAKVELIPGVRESFRMKLISGQK